MTRPVMNYDSQQLAQAVRARRAEACMLDGPSFDILVLESYVAGKDLLLLTGEPDADATESVENALIVVALAGHPDASDDILDALCVTFMIRSWRWDAVLRDQWAGHEPPLGALRKVTDHRESFPTREWFLWRTARLDRSVFMLIRAILAPLTLCRIVELLELPAISVGVKLVQWWEPPVEPESPGQPWRPQ